ncbi:MAG: MFS transporter [Acidimicrobiia bacterium]|nr:MFS transporter [Acidimicrobiia bacterium]
MEPVPPNRTPWRLVAASILVVTVATQPAFIAASTIAQAGPEIGYTAKTLGYLTAAFFLTASASSRLVGRFVEQFGWRRAMLVNAIGAAAVLATIAMFVDSVPGLAVALIIAGAFYGTANPAANLALARVIPSDRRGLIFGLKHAGIPTSSLLAGIAVPAVALTVGWRWAFGISALLAVGVAWLIPPQNDGVRHERSTSSPARGDMAARWLALLSLGSAFATVSAIALGTFHVDAALSLGFGEGAAGNILALGSLASILARASYGALADRRRSDGLHWVAILMAVGALTFAGLGYTQGGWFVVATIVGFSTAWGWPGLFTFGVVQANQGRPAGSTAVTQAGIFLGAGLGPAGLGWIIDNVSYEAAWLTVAACLTVASVLVTIVTRKGLRSEGVPA